MTAMLEVIPAEQTKKNIPHHLCGVFQPLKRWGGKWKPKSRSIIYLRLSSLKDYAPIIREPTVRPHPVSLISVAHFKARKQYPTEARPRCVLPLSFH